MRIEDIKKAAFTYGRMTPTSKWGPIGVELALLAPYFSSEPPKGLDPTFYHTGSYEGDMKQYERLKSLVEAVGVKL